MKEGGGVEGGYLSVLDVYQAPAVGVNARGQFGFLVHSRLLPVTILDHRLVPIA